MNISKITLVLASVIVSVGAVTMFILEPATTIALCGGVIFIASIARLLYYFLEESL